MKDPSVSIDLPSRAVFSKAELGFIDEGLWRGSLALILDVAREVKLITPREFSALASALLDKKRLLSLSHLVRLRGTFDTDTAPLEGIVTVLHQYGFTIQIELPQNGLWPSWLQTADWIVVKSSSPLMTQPFNELHYAPVEGAVLEDATVPLWDLRPHSFYLMKCRAMDELLPFLAKSKAHWQLL
jgi:hypothetical protein